MNNETGRPTPAPRKLPAGVAENSSPTPKTGVPAVMQMRPKPTPVVEPTEMDLFDDGKVPTFATDQLTVEMVNQVIARQVNGGFMRTPAGYVSIRAGLSAEGEVVVSLYHWKSMTFPEQDEIVQVVLRSGALLGQSVES